jgi:predicted KAP-like P-loop ATPase
VVTTAVPALARYVRGMSSEESSPSTAEAPPQTAASSGTSADRPLTDPRADRLGYAPFAEALAKGITSMSAPDGLVVAVYGAWGLGKTTVLNFVEHYLHEEQPEAFVVVRFNPWWFSGRVDIAAAFFDQMRAIFERWQVRGEQARQYAAQLARVVGAVAPGGGGGGEAAGKLIEGKPADVPELKKNLADTLAGQDKRLLIVIDDIDRLTQDEVAELFGVVKGLADFPNTIYVLAFDREQVAKALSGRTAQAGFDYLEKIVQVPFELPLPEQEALRGLLFDHLREIVGEVDEDLLDNEELGALMTHGLDPLMETPRDIVRLTNSLRVTYGAVRGEVNIVDFLALEALRVFEPAVYDRIRARPEMFGVLSGLARAFPQAREEDQRTFHTQWLNEIEGAERREAVKQIVSRLFPETAQILDTRLGVGRRRIDARRARAISEPDYFPLYFRFALGDQVLSREMVAALVAAAADPDDFAQRLLALAKEKTRSGRTRASAMIDELQAQAERGFAVESIPGVIKSLTNIGDKLWIDSDGDFFGVDNETRIIWLIGALLERVPAADRCDLLKDAVRAAECVGTPTLLVRRLARGLGVPTESSTQATDAEQLDERQALITIECGQELEQVAAERIADAAATGHLWGLERLVWVLAEWKRWGDPADVRAWVEGVLVDDEQLAKFIVAVRSQRATAEGLRYRLDPRSLDDLAQRDDVARAVRRLRDTEPGGDVAAACDQYLLELEMLQQGKNPEVRFDWD